MYCRLRHHYSWSIRARSSTCSPVASSSTSPSTPPRWFSMTRCCISAWNTGCLATTSTASTASLMIPMTRGVVYWSSSRASTDMSRNFRASSYCRSNRSPMPWSNLRTSCCRG
jgi:FemAB family